MFVINEFQLSYKIWICLSGLFLKLSINLINAINDSYLAIIQSDFENAT